MTKLSSYVNNLNKDKVITSWIVLIHWHLIGMFHFVWPNSFTRMCYDYDGSH